MSNDEYLTSSNRTEGIGLTKKGGGLLLQYNTSRDLPGLSLLYEYKVSVTRCLRGSVHPAWVYGELGY